MTDGRSGWSLKMLWNECIRTFGMLMVPTHDPLRARLEGSKSSHRYPPPELFEEGKKFHGCCKTCLVQLTSESTAKPGGFDEACEFLAADFQDAPHDPKRSGNGELNYKPDDFERDFLHFDKGACCVDCAVALDYYREVAVPRSQTGIWKEMCDKNIEYASGIISLAAGADVQRLTGEILNRQFEEQEREEALAAEEKQKADSEEATRLAVRRANMANASDSDSGDDSDSDGGEFERGYDLLDDAS